MKYWARGRRSQPYRRTRTEKEREEEVKVSIKVSIKGNGWVRLNEGFFKMEAV